MPASATLTTLSSILKDLYLPPVVEQLNNEVLFLQRLETRSDEIFGNQAIVPLHFGRSGRIGSRGENEQLPQQGAQQYQRAVYDLKYHYGGVRVTGPSMAKTSSQAGAFLQALQSELDGIRNDLRRDIARQCYGDGTGSLGQTALNATTTTLTLNASAYESLVKGQIYVGQFIDGGTLANPTLNFSNREITNYAILTSTTSTITISGANVSTANNDLLFVQGNELSGSVSRELTGIQALVSTAATTVGGITEASAPWWVPIRDATGGALAKDPLTKAFAKVNIAGGNPSIMIGSFGMQRALFNLLQTQVQYIEPLHLKGGFTAIEYMGQPFVADRDAPWGKVYLLDERFLKVFTNRDWHFLDEDGHILKQVAGFDAWEATLTRYMNLGISRRNVQMVLSGFNNDPDGV